MTLLKKIIALFLVLIISAFALFSCNTGSEETSETPDEGGAYTRNNIVFNALLTCNGKKVGENSVFTVKGNVSNSLTLETENGRLCMGMMLFADGMPLEFTVKGEKMSYLEFSFSKNKVINFTYPASKAAAEGSDVQVVLLTNRDFEQISSEILKSYTFTISYTAKGSGKKQIPAGAENIQFYNMSEKINEKTGDKTIVSECLAALDTNSFMSYITEGQKWGCRCGYTIYEQEEKDFYKFSLCVYGKPGKYITTFFNDGVCMGESVCYSLEEYGIGYIPFEKPEFVDYSMITMYALTYSVEDKTFYDSAEYYFTPASPSQGRRNIKIYINNEEFLHDAPIVYNGGEISLKHEFELFSGVEWNVHIVLIADGVIQEYNIDGKTYTAYPYQIKYGKNEIALSFTPVVREQGDFTIQLLPVYDLLPNHPSDIESSTSAWTGASFTCGDGVKLNTKEVAGMESFEPTENTGSFRFSVLTNGALGYIEHTDLLKGNDFTIDVTFSTKYIDKPIVQFLIFNGEIIESSYFAFDELGKVHVSYCFPAEKLSESNKIQFYTAQLTGSLRQKFIFIVDVLEEDEVSLGNAALETAGGDIIFTPDGKFSVYLPALGTNEDVSSIFGNNNLHLEHCFSEEKIIIKKAYYRAAVIRKIEYVDGTFRFIRKNIQINNK